MKTAKPDPISKITGNNFQLILLEVTKQIEETLKVLDKPNSRIIEKIDARDDYIDNLKSVIERECFYRSEDSKLTKRELDIFRSLYIIANNLERIADFAVNIVRQTEYLKSPDFIHRFRYRDAFNDVLGALKLVDKAFRKRDLTLGLQICKAELRLDVFFESHFKQIMHELRTGRDTENLVTTLFILRYLERMGDSLLNIGEAIIFAVVGERVKIQHIKALEDTIGDYEAGEKISDLSIQAFLGTKSGCKISKVLQNANLNEKGVLFKEGRLDKLEKEKESIKKWEDIVPNVVPKVYSYQKNGKNASILLEYLEGPTVQKALLESKAQLLKESTSALKKLLLEIWSKTKIEESSQANFIGQLKSRIQDIYKAHPDYKKASLQIGNLETFTLEGLIGKVEERKDEFFCPFSVFIHGDFNLDNVIYNVETKNIHFIDLHRSCYQDFVQDISVFLVSIFRIPVFVQKIRARMSRFSCEFYEFGKAFAVKNGDKTYDARLALGLARSLITSTRFEFDLKFAETMQLRSFYLLEKLSEHQDSSLETFEFPIDVLSYS